MVVFKLLLMAIRFLAILFKRGEKSFEADKNMMFNLYRIHRNGLVDQEVSKLVWGMSMRRSDAVLYFLNGEVEHFIDVVESTRCPVWFSVDDYNYKLEIDKDGD
jgi:hypothetical protein